MFSFGFSDVKEQSQQELVWKTMLLQIEMLSVTNYLFAHTSSLEHCCSLVCFCAEVQIFVNTVFVLFLRKEGSSIEAYTLSNAFIIE